MKTTLIMIVFFFMVSTANAVCLHGHPRAIKEEFSNSQGVFIGKVVSAAPVSESGKYLEGQNYAVEVQKVFKGKLTNTIIIFCENSSGRFPMTVGQTYIIFLYNDGRFQIDNCGNSGLVSQKQEIVKAVKQLRANKQA